MKKTLTLGTLLLGCCLAAVAQTGSTPNQTPPSSTPSTFPQDQTGQTPSNPAPPGDPSAIPPDTKAPGQMANQATQASNSQATTVQGCLSQSSEGNFVLADNSGNNFHLRGDTSQLNSYIGKEVRVEGIATNNSRSPAGAMSSSTTSSGSSSGATTQFSVSSVHKVADTCTTASTNK
jgi:hypothetical protein